jgi:hypothetical protein
MTPFGRQRASQLNALCLQGDWCLVASGKERRTSNHSSILVIRNPMTLELDKSISQMNLLVRSADVYGEEKTITKFLSAYLTPDANEIRYQWLYHLNPAGVARVWVAYDAGAGSILGVSAAFPRQVFHRGQEMKAYVLGDFCIHPDRRSLGPALALQRRTLEDLDRSGAGLVFDFPSNAMLAVYKRLRVEPRESVIRFAKLLRADRQIRNRISTKLAATALSLVANWALRLRDFGLRRSSTWTIREESAPCGEEFTLGFRQWAPGIGVCADRSAEYLNWRYLQHPLKHYHILTARRDGKLCGFLVYEREGENATVADFMANEEKAVRGLLVETIAMLRQQGVHTISAPFLESHPGRAILEDCGFRPRESAPVMLIPTAGAANWESGPFADRCYLTHGDRES